jgi:hypothetical protein
LRYSMTRMLFANISSASANMANIIELLMPKQLQLAGAF